MVKGITDIQNDAASGITETSTRFNPAAFASLTAAANSAPAITKDPASDVSIRSKPKDLTL